jgi:formyl-CoA transferase
MAQALDHGQTQANGMVVAYDKPAQKGGNEKMRLVGTPIHMDEQAFRLRHPPPGLGQHGREILCELGYDAAGIERLVAEKVLA